MLMQDIGSKYIPQYTYANVVVQEYESAETMCTALIGNQRVEFVAPPLGEYIEIGTQTYERLGKLQTLRNILVTVNKPINKEILRIVNLYIELSIRISVQVPRISGSLALMAMHFVDSQGENDSVILETINIRDPRIIEEIENIKRLTSLINESKLAIDELIAKHISGSQEETDFANYAESFERIAMSELPDIQKVVAFFEYSIQTLEFSKSRACAKKWLDANQVALRVYFASNIPMFVSICAFYDMEGHFGISVLACAFGLNLLIIAILCLSPPIIFEGPSSWFWFSKREKHLRYFERSCPHLEDLVDLQCAPTHETLYLSTTPYEIRQQTRKIEEAWNIAQISCEAQINQVFNNSDQSSPEPLLTSLRESIMKTRDLKNQVIDILVGHSVKKLNAWQRFKENLRQRDVERLKGFKNKLIMKPDFQDLVDKCKTLSKEVRGNEGKIGIEPNSFPLTMFLMKLKEEIKFFDWKCDGHHENMKVCGTYWGKLLGYRSMLKSFYYFFPAPLTGSIQLYRHYCKVNARWMLALSILFGVSSGLAILLLIAGVFLQIYTYYREGALARRFQSSSSRL